MPQHVADRSDSVDESLASTRLQLATKVADRDFDQVRTARKIIAPALLPQLRAADRSTRIAHHIGEQLEFAIPQRQQAARSGDFTRILVQREVRKKEHS